MIYIRKLRPDHWALLAGCPWHNCEAPKFPDPHMEAFFSNIQQDAEFGVGAWENGMLVGLLRFNSWEPGTLAAAGTFVSQSHRGRGIARRLWLAALRSSKWSQVEVDTISAGGSALVKRVVVPYCERHKITYVWGNGI